MNQYVEFATNHLYLTTAFIVLSLMLIYSFIGNRLRGFGAIVPAEAIRLINRENALILDVREENEFLSGHIVNSLHIPLSFLGKRLDELQKHKDKPIIVGCKSGQRSASACTLLKKQGFEQIYNLQGGIAAWQSDNLPLVKKK
jgi:rhodanese-related sulfurtransferase